MHSFLDLRKHLSFFLPDVVRDLLPKNSHLCIVELVAGFHFFDLRNELLCTGVLDLCLIHQALSSIAFARQDGELGR